MSTALFDTHLTFHGFVVGPANRLAASAARRVVDAPGAAYNPLFLYGASGLGKTHLLMAIGNEATRANPRLVSVYLSVDPQAQDLTAGSESLRERLESARLLLADDVQFLGDRRGVQDDLIAVWDAVAARGGQVVLASDRPPNEIAGLDARLLSRFSGGLIADIGPPSSETRVAIVRRKAAEGGHILAAGVAEALARSAFANVRELHGGLNRVLAVQEVEQRLVTAGEVAVLLGEAPEERGNEEFTTFIADVETAVDALVARNTPEQRLAEAILRYEGDGYRTSRLESALGTTPTPEEAEELVRDFQEDVLRLEETTAAIRELDAHAPELARVDVLLDPNRIEEAESLLQRVQERTGAEPIAGAPAPGGNGAAAAAHRRWVRAAVPRARRAPPGDVADEWFLSRDRVIWQWPAIDDWIVAESD